MYPRRGGRVIDVLEIAVVVLLATKASETQLLQMPGVLLP